MKVFTIAEVPDELEQKWLQHLRDFDVAHPGCHFQVMADAAPNVSVADMVERLRVEPALSFTEIFERERHPGGKDKDLYDVARRITHDMGMPWTDPRTMQTHQPPGKKES
jgi:hypothetical protein